LLLQPVFFILHFAFFALHYLFASQTAHIGALYAAFLAMMLASGAAVWCSILLNLSSIVAQHDRTQLAQHDSIRQCLIGIPLHGRAL
jgi:hypothetical protein